jgi:4-hydroxy-tetrahydrodipicolinate reductase
MALAAAVERPGYPAGQDAGAAAGLPPLGVLITDDLAGALARRPDVVLDFTTFEASAACAEACARAGVALVIGSTGFTPEARARVAAAARRVPIVLSPNMSVGVNAMFELVRRAAAALGDAYDVEIVEMHHRMKKDAPSGTAVRLAEVAAEALGRDPRADLRFQRSGMVGERPPREIGVQALRGGDVVGEHTVLFAGMGERLEITHRATSREQFARGAVRAARWVVGKPAGLYDMRHVLGLGTT